MKIQKNDKRKYGMILAAMVLFLGAGIAYALLSDDINLGGTASTSGDLDVEISAVSKTDVGSTNSSYTVLNDKNSISLTVPQLEYPGAYTEFVITLSNVGNISAKLKNIVENGLTSDDNIEITYSGISENDILGVGENKNITVIVQWKSSSSSQTTEPINFNIDFSFEQNI